MKEALFILIVLVVLVVLTAVRYRRQIATMLHIFRSLKAARQQMTKGRDQSSAADPISAGPLVNCSKCGTWVPEDRAIKLRGGVFYCSSNCLEKTAQAR